MAVEAANHDIQVYLPDDLIFNILSRLPCKCLLRFKSVCKSWYSLITHDTVFRTLHLRNSTSDTNGDSLWAAIIGKTNCYLLYGSNFWVYDSNFPFSTRIHPDHVPIEQKLPSSRMVYHSNIVGWCDGIVAILQHSINLGTLICLWNPSIRKCKKIFLPWNNINNKSRFKPKLDRNTYTYNKNLCYGFGLDVERKEYKFVIVCPDNDKEASHVLVYSLKTGRWVKIDIDLKPVSPTFYLRGQRFHATYFNGACHWILNDVGRGEDIVLSFNLSGQSFRYRDLPSKSPPCGYGDKYDNSFKLSVWKDMISVSDTTKEGTMFALNIWVIKDYLKSGCWSLIKKVYIKEDYWGKNIMSRDPYCLWGRMPWGITSKYFNKYFKLGSTTPFIDSLRNDEAQEIQKYLASSLDDLVPFQESLVLP